MRILVVSPHPDDETLGAGGTLLKRKEIGDEIFWLNITNVDESGKWSAEFLEKRKDQITAISAFYDFDGIYDLKFCPSELENIDKGTIISEIGKCIEEVRPEWLILPDPNDAHKDHKIVFESCMACSKVFRHPYIKKIITMEILSETDFGTPDGYFVPNYYVDITSTIERKLQAMEIYDTELGKQPFPRSLETIKALGVIRGAAAGSMYAEAFKIIKEIE